MKNVLLITFFSIALFSCKKQSELRIVLNHNVAANDFKMNEMNYLSPAGHNYEITKLQYYISEITFIGKDGSSVQTGGHLIDMNDQSTLAFPVSIAQGSYNKMEFQFGISKENNKESYLENTVENQNMFWPAQMEAAGEKGDYHYMKFEGRYDSLSTGTILPFIFHAGPTNGNDNSFKVSFDIDEMNGRGKKYDLNIAVDLQEWFQNPTEYDFKDYSMVMMNQATQEIYKANGKNVFSFDFLVGYE